jgi:parallel beta-helix repeat protein
MPIVTCAALALAMANPSTTGSFTLSEDCRPRMVNGVAAAAIMVPVLFQRPVVVEAGTHRIAGLAVVGGGNLLWRGGQILAPGGEPDRFSSGPAFYAVRLDNARAVTLDGINLTNARKGVVVKGSTAVTVIRSRCQGKVEDCMIVSDSQTIRFTNNIVGPMHVEPSKCQIGEIITTRVPRKRCEADGGKWADGWHSDVLQLRDAVIDVLASGNRIDTQGQGLTQMAGKNDRPLSAVRFENNVIASGRHGLTLNNCSDCRITGNRLTSSVAGWKSVIRPGEAAACGNDVPNGGPGRERCPD